jgi:PAS domain-containing protein
LGSASRAEVVMISSPSQIDLRTFPSGDAAFRRFAGAELSDLDAPDPELLQRSIRLRYPLAVVRVRSDLASLRGEGIVWYAFRRAFADPPDDHWWESGPSWAIIDGQRVFVEASEGFAAIVELPAELLIGRRIEDLANPADPTAVDDVAALWIEVLARGHVHGTLRFNRLDGSPREIEYHLYRDGAEPERFRAAIRERTQAVGNRPG